MRFIDFTAYIKSSLLIFYVVKFNVILKDFDLIDRAKEIFAHIIKINSSRSYPHFIYNNI